MSKQKQKRTIENESESKAAVKTETEEKKLPFYRRLNEYFSLQRIFQSNRTIMVLSVIIALALWITVVALDTNKEKTRTIHNVPVQVELGTDTEETLGLNAFGVEDLKVTVTLKGRSIDLSNVAQSDFEVTATPAGVTGPGQWTALVSAKRTNTNLAFEVSDWYPRSFQIQLDRIVENKSFDIEANNNGSVKVPKDYVLEKPHASPSTVTISGPESDISRITRVVAETNIDEEISATNSYPASLVLYDQYDNVISQNDLSIDLENVEIIMTVFAQKEMEVKVEDSNGPENRDGITFEIDPSAKMTVRCPTDDTNTQVSEISVGPVDFSKISQNSTLLRFSVGLPTGYHLVDPVDEITVNVKLTGKTAAMHTVSAISFADSGAAQKYRIVTPKIEKVYVVGSEAEILTLTPSDITAVIELPKETADQMEVPVKFSFKKHPSCWVYGSYTATIQTL